MDRTLISFTVDNNGQIKTKGDLDFETQATHTVVLNATDPSGATDSILVTINVTDAPDNAVIVLGPLPEPEPEVTNNAPAFNSETAALSVDENSPAGADVGDPVVATDADEDDTISYNLSGDDAASFAIWASGQITVAEGAAIDYETQSSYTVTVTASDGTDSASIDVTINVNDLGLSNAYDVDDSGDISKDEAVQAVQDFFAETITRGEAIAVIQLYFAG